MDVVSQIVSNQLVCGIACSLGTDKTLLN